MTKETRYIPTRLFISISLGQILVGSLIAGFVASYFYHPANAPGRQLLSKLSNFPTSTSFRAKLVQTYLDLNNQRMAQNEINFQHSLSAREGNALGASTEFTNLEDKITAKATNDANLEEHWLKIADEYPNYRDAWVQLLFLAKNRGDFQKTTFYLERIRELDPNFLSTLPQSFKVNF